MENEKVFDTWFRMDVRPFKQALLNTVCKWGNLFKKHLVDEVINRYERVVVQGIVFFKSSLLKEELRFIQLRFTVLSYYSVYSNLSSFWQELHDSLPSIIRFFLYVSSITP
jgi:hypothetical protein